jgi:hypothetical protein
MERSARHFSSLGPPRPPKPKKRKDLDRRDAERAVEDFMRRGGRVVRLS